MGRHAEWIKARQELAEASKAVHYWDVMPDDLRTRMSVWQYQEKRAEARRRFRRADNLCREANVARRTMVHLESRA